MVDVLAEVTKFVESNPRMIIDGHAVDAASGDTFDVVDPSTGSPVARVPRGGKEDVDRAVAAARAAFDDRRWTGLRPGKRAEVLFKLGELIKRRTAELSQIESLDSGKPIKLSSGEIWAAGEAFRYYSGWPTKVFGETNPSTDEMFVYSLREPVGVCGEQAEREPLLVADQLVRLRLHPDCDRHERRLERDRAEGVDGDAVAPARVARRHHRDPGREPAKHLAKPRRIERRHRPLPQEVGA